MKRFVIVVAGIATFTLAGDAGAEVAVRTVGQQRQFKSFRNDVHVEHGYARRWQRTTGPLEDEYLNQDGDERADLDPVSVLIPAGRLQIDPSPLVVWSRQRDNGILAIYWSRWTTANGWTPPKPLVPDAAFDETQPTLFLDPHGNVHAAWRTSSDWSAVWYAKFVGGAWSQAQHISPTEQMAQSPRFEFTPEGKLLLRWEDWTQRPIRVLSLLREEFDP